MRSGRSRARSASSGSGSGPRCRRARRGDDRRAGRRGHVPGDDHRPVEHRQRPERRVSGLGRARRGPGVGSSVPTRSPSSAHFPSRTVPGPADVRVEVLREGGRSTAVARLEQDGQPRVLGARQHHGDLGTVTGPTAVLEATPPFPPPEECDRGEGPMAPEFAKRFDLRLTPDTAVWATSRPSGTPVPGAGRISRLMARCRSLRSGRTNSTSRSCGMSATQAAPSLAMSARRTTYRAAS